MSSRREDREGSNPAGANPATAASPESRLRVWLVCIGLAAGTLAIYGQALGFQFVFWDDDVFIVENKYVAGGFTWDNFIWSLKIHGPGHWHPLSWWVHQFNCQLFGLEPGPHHLVNASLHAAAALALFMAFLRLSSDFWPSALVAALFALHPLSVESVAWVSHLRDPLSTLFWALVMWSYVAYIRRGSSRRYLLVLLLFALGLMAKPMLITLPFVLLLLDYWPLERVNLAAWSREPGAARAIPGLEIHHRSVRRLLLEKAPLFALAGVSVWLSYLCQQAAGAVRSLEFYPMGSRLANAAQSCVLHLYHILWPVELAPIYPFPDSFHAPQVAAAVIVLLSLTAAAVYFGRRRQHLLVGWLWFLGTLVPVIGLLKMGVPTSMADHHAYVPLLGICIALAWTLAGLVRRRPVLRPAVIAAVAVALLGLLALGRRQAAVWSDTVTLFENTLAVTSDNYLAHNNLGIALLEQAKTLEAIEHYHSALRIKPGFAEAHNNLGNALLDEGKIDEAIEHFHRASQIKPGYTRAYYNLGVAFQRRGNLVEAIEHFHRALRITPDDAEAQYELGNALMGQGKTAEAIERYSEALRINANFAEAHNNLGKALLEQRKIVEAIGHFQQALRIDPGLARPHINLANALQTQAKIAEAIEHYHQALQIDPADAKAHNNLGVALLRQGRTVEAIEHFHQALRINPDLAEAQYSLGKAFSAQEDIPAALRHYARALELKPNLSPALNALAWIRATHADAAFRDGAQAVELAGRSCELTGHSEAEALDTLAAAYAEAGRFAEAVQTATRAIDAAIAAGDEPLARKIRSRLVIYRQDVPYRAPGE